MFIMACLEDTHPGLILFDYLDIDDDGNVIVTYLLELGGEETATICPEGFVDVSPRLMKEVRKHDEG